MRHSLALILVSWLVLTLAGCSLLPEIQDETKGWSAQKLYTSAKENLDEGDYEKAIKYFETLEARYPYGRYAQQAQLEVAYAYYLKGLVNFNDDLGFLGFVVKQDLSDRDPKAARDSFDTFKELVTRFPNSKYTPDATLRMNYLVNAMSGHEAAVAHYYYRRGAYVAAVNRAQGIIKDYPQTPANEDALAIMWHAYDKMGLTQLRDDSLRVLKLNFPNSKYLAGKPVGEPRPWYQFW